MMGMLSYLRSHPNIKEVKEKEDCGLEGVWKKLLKKGDSKALRLKETLALSLRDSCIGIIIVIHA